MALLHTPGSPRTGRRIWALQRHGTSGNSAGVPRRGASRRCRPRGRRAVRRLPRVREEGTVQEQHGTVNLVVFNVRNMGPGRHEAAGLVQAVGEGVGAAAADLRVDQLVAEGFTVLVGIAGEQRGHGAVGHSLGMLAAVFRQRPAVSIWHGPWSA